MAIQASPGERVGEYFLTRKIGEGGMAEVWLARHESDAQLRALKFLNHNYQGIPEVEARFQNEGESKLVHPNIVRIFEVGQESGSSFIAMEFVDGQNLEDILNSRRGPLTITESVDIGTQVLAGLGFAHANGIVHRDIKPSNVLVDRDGRAYVMDFGIAKVLRTGRALTQINSRLGTPDYMSPEQIRNPRDVDSRSDIYSFGCLFYELLTGWPPFDRGEGYETEHDIKTAHVTQPPTPPMQRKAGLPAMLNDITLKCLAKAKEDRPQSCEEVIAAIHAYRVSVVPRQAQTILETSRRETNVLTQQEIFNQPKLPERNKTFIETPQVIQQNPQQNVRQQTSQNQLPNNAEWLALQQKRKESGGLIRLFLIAAGSLFLLVAAGGGGWVWYHKHQEELDANKKPEPAVITPYVAPPPPVVTPKPAPKQDQEDFSVKPPAPHRDTVVPPAPKPNPPIGLTPAHTTKGTLIWTGNFNSGHYSVTIIRSANIVLGGGRVSGTMFPAGPVVVTVRAPSNATVIQPQQATSYNSLQLFVPDAGPQTIYLDWVALPAKQ